MTLNEVIHAAPLSGLGVFGICVGVFVFSFVLVTIISFLFKWDGDTTEAAFGILGFLVLLPVSVYCMFHIPTVRDQLYRNWIQKDVEPYISTLTQNRVTLLNYQLNDSQDTPTVPKTVQELFHSPGEVLPLSASYMDKNGVQEQVCVYANVIADGKEKSAYMIYKNVTQNLGDDVSPGFYQVVVHVPHVGGE